MIYIVCFCLCVRDREGTDVQSHMWLQSVFLLGLPHSLPSRMTPDCFRHLQGLSKHDSSWTLSSLLQKQIIIWGTLWPKDRILQEHPRLWRVWVCAPLRVSAVVSTDGPVNTPRVSDISLVYCPGSRSGVLWLVYLAFRYRMKPATHSHKHMCVPPVGACSISFVETINSHAKTCSHDDTTYWYT